MSCKFPPPTSRPGTFGYNGVLVTSVVPIILAYDESEEEDDNSLQRYNHHETMGPIKRDVTENVYGDYNTSSEPATISCRACEKKFSTKGSLTRHLARFPICGKWNQANQAVPQQTVLRSTNILELLQKIEDSTIGTADPEGFKCRFCESSYSSAGNLKKHFERATTCSKSAVKYALTVVKDFVLPG